MQGTISGLVTGFLKYYGFVSRIYISFVPLFWKIGMRFILEGMET